MNSVKVWDPFVRLFHWSLVIAVIGLYATGETLPRVHVRIGYSVVFLVLARILWGLAGTKHARFADFIYPPREIVQYLRGLIKGHPHRYLGHNPAGGLMVIVLLLSLLLTAFTGLLTLGAKGQGPLAQSADVLDVSSVYADQEEQGEDDDDDDRDGLWTHRQATEAGEFWEEVHEALTDLLIVLICLHLGGVLVSSWRHRENLVRAMLGGRKIID